MLCIYFFTFLGDENVYKRLHSHFTWMLKTGALTYSETLYTSKDLLDKICPKTMKTTIFEQDICLSNYDGEVPIRSLENLLSKSIFRILLYCILTGIDVSNIYFFIYIYTYIYFVYLFLN